MVDEVEFEQLRDQLRANAGAMGRMTAALEAQNKSSRSEGRASARAKLERDMESAADRVRTAAYKTAQATDHVSSSMSVLTGRTDVAAERMKVFANAIPGGALLGSMVAWGKNTIDTWKEMTDVGQSFNGSMFNLAQAAAEAGVPLSDFAKQVKDNSKTVAVYGARNVTQLMKEVRHRTEANGMFGYTMESLDKVTGEYLETQRLYGNKAAATNKKSIESSVEFARQITAVAGATGQARETVLAATMAAMRDVAFTSAMIGRSSGDIQAFSDATMRSVAILAGLPGVAGETFGQFLSQSVGFGTAIFTDATQTFIEGGLGQMVSSTDALAAAITNGGGDIENATWQYIEDFKGQVEGNREGLRIQAMAGNQSAKRILQMYAEVENLSKADYDRRKREADDTKALTAFFSSVGNVFKRLLSSLMVGVFGKLEDIETQVSSIFESEAFKGLEARFEGWGKAIGEWLGRINAQDVENFANGLEHGMNVFLNLINAAAAVFQGFTRAIGVLQQVFGGTLGSIIGVVGGLTLLAKLPDIVGGTLMRVGGMFGRMRQNDMMVRAANVYVNGGPMGMGGDFGGGGRRGGRSGRGANSARFGSRYGTGTTQERWAARQMARRTGGLGAGAAVAAGSAGMGSTLARVSDGASGGGMLSSMFRRGGRAAAGAGARAGGRGLFKMGAKGAGKSLLKKIPGISILAGLGFGAQRALSGDFLGAGGEVLSGVLGTIPGLGTAASLGIDAALMGRDMGAFGAGRPGAPGGPDGQAAPGRRAGGFRMPRLGRLGTLALGGLGAGGLGLGAAWAMGAFNGNNGRPNTDAAVDAIERTAREQNRTAQTDPRIANLEKQTTEMKAIQEAQLLTNREVLNTLKRLLQVQQQVNSSLS